MCEPTMVPKTARPSENETRTMHQPHRVATIGPGVLVLWCRASGARQHSPVALVVVGGGSHTRGIVVCVRSYETMAAGRHDPTRCVCARSGVFVHLWCAFLCACVRVQTSVPMPRIHTKRWASPSLPLPSGAARTLWCVHGTHTTVRDTARHVSLGLVLHGAVIEKDVVLLVRIVVLLAPDPSLLLLLLGGSVVPRGGRDHPRDRVVRLRRSPAAVARARRRVPRGSVGRDGRRRCGVSGRVPGRRTLGGSTTGAASLGGTRGVGVVVDHRRLVLGVVVGVVAGLEADLLSLRADTGLDRLETVIEEVALLPQPGDPLVVAVPGRRQARRGSVRVVVDDAVLSLERLSGVVVVDANVVLVDLEEGPVVGFLAGGDDGAGVDTAAATEAEAPVEGGIREGRGFRRRAREGLDVVEDVIQNVGFDHDLLGQRFDGTGGAAKGGFPPLENAFQHVPRLGLVRLRLRVRLRVRLVRCASWFFHAGFLLGFDPGRGC
mmetsp:Transcript_19574/g.40373  ORF Transcript_19574/g.40373 Transcript_19574/m.40373 type:complete len:492 (+) Transcript_19574:1431-2906(+)